MSVKHRGIHIWRLLLIFFETADFPEKVIHYFKTEKLCHVHIFCYYLIVFFCININKLYNIIQPWNQISSRCVFQKLCHFRQFMMASYFPVMTSVHGMRYTIQCPLSFDKNWVLVSWLSEDMVTMDQNFVESEVTVKNLAFTQDCICFARMVLPCKIWWKINSMIVDEDNKTN